jgi:putative ABC transport system permease protein
VWSTSALRHAIGSMNIPRAHEIAIDGTVLGVALAVAVVTGLAFGLAPALRASRVELTGALKDGGRGSAAGADRLRRGLIIGEVALSLVLLVGAGLLWQSFVRVLGASAGLEPEHALTLQLTVTDANYPDNDRRLAFFNRVAERVAQLPGVTAAGLGGTTPFVEGGSDTFVRIPGWSGDHDPGFDAIYDWCTPDYFRALGVPLRAGRYFEPRDYSPGHREAIINEAMVHACFPNENPLGRQLVYGKDAWEIVGVVGDVRVRGLARPAQAIVYRAQQPDAWRYATLFVRTTGAPMAIAESVRKAIQEIDQNEPVDAVRTLADVASAAVGDRRLTAALLALFALAALSLAAIGLYGVIAYAVGQRTREFGIRLALGATKKDVLSLVLGQALLLAGIGLACGFAGSLGLTRFLGKFLYEIKPTDPLTFVVVSLLLFCVALLASWLPARRATKIDPIVALRCD